MGIPLSDDNPTRRRAIVTIALLVVNVAVFLFVEPWASTDPCAQQAFFVRNAVVPDELFTGEPLDASEVAQSTTPACSIQPTPGKNVYLALLSSMFLHAGFLHLAGNMLFLAIFGNNVEDRMGRLRYLAFYLACGVIATGVFSLANARSPVTLVGASGAIAGVLGAYLVMFPLARVLTIVPIIIPLPLRLPAVLVLGFWFVGQLVVDDVADLAGGGVAYLAHVAGFLAGALITWRMGYRPRRPQRLLPRPPPGWR